MDKVPMTLAGNKQLQDELEHLKHTKRPQVVAAIAEARGHGDLKENAEYHAAREQQGFVEGRIKEVEYKLSQAVVIDVRSLPQDGRVVFGVTAVIEHLENEEQVSYQIVGDDEADFKQGKISVSSPIARALIGKSEGDIIEVKAPSGIIEYELIEVKYL